MTEGLPSRGPGRLTGKVALVTGAGSRGPGLGNGKATAILFAREGAHVLCVDQVKERAEETVGLIRADGGTAEAFAADVTRAVRLCRHGGRRRAALGRPSRSPQQRRHRIAQGSSRDHRGRVGPSPARRPQVDAAGDPERRARVMDRGQRRLGSSACRPSPPCAATGGRPTRRPRPGSSVSSAASPSSSAPRGIRVNAIAPGPVWTPMVGEIWARRPGSVVGTSTPLATEGTGWDVGLGRRLPGQRRGPLGHGADPRDRRRGSP